MKKSVGYIIAIIGLFIFLISFAPVSKLLGFSLPAGITDTTVSIVSLILIIVGAFFIYKSKTPQQPSEVPIYHGEKVVGFRRLGKQK